jgi:hypothetical protein
MRAGGTATNTNRANAAEPVQGPAAPAELGHTRIELPWGGLASTVSQEVRAPRIPVFGFLAAVGAGAVAALVAVRVLLW